MKAPLLLLAAVLVMPACTALVVEGRPPSLSTSDESACVEQGGCVYVTKSWLAARMAEARERGRREAKTQCRERAGITL